MEKLSKQRYRFKEELINIFLEQSLKGINVKGGPRTNARIISLRRRLKKWDEWAEVFYNKTITKLSYQEIMEICHDLQRGNIKRIDGQPYKSSADYMQDIKTFWSWYKRYMRREHNKNIPNNTEDIDTSDKQKERSFHFMSKEQVETLIKALPERFRALTWFYYDTGIRPQEIKHLKRKDLQEQPNGKLRVTISEEVSKTFSRKPTLEISSNIVKQYLENNPAKPEQPLFDYSVPTYNNSLAKKGYKLFGYGEEAIKEEKKGGYVFKRKYVKNGLKQYDLRHCSACYWVLRIKNHTLLMKRFGWKKPDKIFYYTHFLGIDEEIPEEDLYIQADKTKLEKEVAVLKEMVVSIAKKTNQKEVLKKLIS